MWFDTSQDWYKEQEEQATVEAPVPLEAFYTGGPECSSYWVLARFPINHSNCLRCRSHCHPILQMRRLRHKEAQKRADYRPQQLLYLYVTRPSFKKDLPHSG